MNLAGSLCKYEYKNLYYIILISLLYILSINNYANDLSYTTVIEYPAITEGKILKPSFTPDFKRLFFTGKQDNTHISGYYNSRHFLGWEKYSFTPLDYFEKNDKSILSVCSGLANDTLVLSHIENVGYLISNTSDGISWSSQNFITNKYNLEHLISTDANMFPLVIAYGSNSPLFLVSTYSSNWQEWALPNPCKFVLDCNFVNHFFNGVSNGYILLQSRTLLHEKINKFYFSSNLTNWYNYSLPFENDDIINAFKAKNDTLLVSVVDKNANHKLWLSGNYKNWESFDLPADAKVADAKIDRFNNILLLLNYQNDSSSENTATQNLNIYTSKLVKIDNKTNLLTEIQTFVGLVNNIEWFEDKIYMSGDFINPSDNKHVALAEVIN